MQILKKREAEHPHHKGHIPPHERRAMFNVTFDDKDSELLEKIFGNKDSAAAAVEIICTAPPEMQVVAVQILKLIQKRIQLRTAEEEI
jgi:hypothetical protein